MIMANQSQFTRSQKRWRPITATLMAGYLLLAGGSVRAQESAEAPPAMTAAEQQFFSRLDGIRKYLLESGRFGLTGASEWKMESAHGDTQGELHVKLAIGSGQRVRLEVGPSSDAPPGFVVISDGKQLLRSYGATGRYCLLETPTPRDDLESDGITLPAVQATGMQFLIRTNPQGTLRAQTTHVEALGDAEVGGVKSNRYRLVLANGERWTLDLAEAAPHLPQQLLAETTIPSQDDTVTRYTARTVFQWLEPSQVVDSLFIVAPAAGAQRVASMAELRGEPAHEDTPEHLATLTFQSLDGQPMPLAKIRGDSPLLVYFWASWATPSADAMPAISAFIKDYTARNVKFLAVNVGDAPESVAKYAEEKGITVPLACDPQAQTLEAFGVRSLPGVAVFDADGNLKLTLDASTPDRLTKVKAALEQMLR
jgi:peroxiredoxin